MALLIFSPDRTDVIFNVTFILRYYKYKEHKHNIKVIFFPRTLFSPLARGSTSASVKQGPVFRVSNSSALRKKWAPWLQAEKRVKKRRGLPYLLPVYTAYFLPAARKMAGNKKDIKLLQGNVKRCIQTKIFLS